MFHLLVAYKGWPDSAGTISTDRIYIKADSLPGSSFLTNSKLDITKVSKIPALLVTETGGDGPQLARVAYINQLTQTARNTTINYTVDHTIRPVSNLELERLADQLGIDKYTLTHTHWQVCDADLFRALLLNEKKGPGGPKVFSIDSMHEQESDLVSVMIPFKAEFDPVVAALKLAMSKLGLRCVRADDIWEHHAIVQDVVNLIGRARIVICDCSGKNANVFYEIGIAHTLGKEVLLIAQAEEDVPFDLRHLRHVRYLPNGEGLSELSRSVEKRVRTVMASTR